MRLIILSATLTIAALLVAVAGAQTRYKAAAPTSSNDVLLERSINDRSTIELMSRRISLIEAEHSTARERLARMETSQDIQGKLLWALITMAAGLVLDRVKSAIKTREPSDA